MPIIGTKRKSALITMHSAQNQIKKCFANSFAIKWSTMVKVLAFYQNVSCYGRMVPQLQWKFLVPCRSCSQDQITQMVTVYQKCMAWLKCSHISSCLAVVWIFMVVLGRQHTRHLWSQLDKTRRRVSKFAQQTANQYYNMMLSSCAVQNLTECLSVLSR